MDDDGETTHPAAVRRLFGLALIAVGGLMALLSGGCALTFTGQVVMEAVKSGQYNGLVLAPLPLIFGGFGFAPGVMLILFGRSLYRGTRL